ncbi:MAG: hypothetical protein ABIS51_07530 [Sphingomonas sp.]
MFFGAWIVLIVIPLFGPFSTTLLSAVCCNGELRAASRATGTSETQAL